MTTDSSSHLKRDLSLLDVMALGVNAVIGQGIFLLPGIAAALLGPASLGALVLAAVIALVIALCFAEVGGRFRKTGGAYLYARETFGPFVGFEVGWMLCWVGFISWAALANGFVLVLGYFLPSITSGWLNPTIAIGLMALLGGINMFGAKMGARVSTFFSIAKLVPVALFIVVGILHIDGALYQPFAPHGWENLAEGTLLLLYAFVGFESAVVPAGEMENPQRAIPIAMTVVMILVAFAYFAVLGVTMGTFAEVAGHHNPVAAASQVFMGNFGGTLIATGIVVSVFGINTGAALVIPRKVYAFAEKGDLPHLIAHVDPKSGVPRVAIAVTFAVAAVLCLTGTFKELAILGVVARFAQYIPTCLAVVVLRRRHGLPEGFKLPFGFVIPVLAIGACIWLMVSADPMKLLAGLACMALGIPFYWWAKRTRAQSIADNAS